MQEYIQLILQISQLPIDCYPGAPWIQTRSDSYALSVFWFAALALLPLINGCRCPAG
jgi:hypothetical protein